MRDYVFESLDRIEGAESFELIVDGEGVKVVVMKNDGSESISRWCGLTSRGVMELLDCLNEYFDEDM